MIIGITGQIGSGKTQVARIFARHGACVISADEIGKEVVDNNSRVLNRLVTAFGADILTPGGKLRRRVLGRIAFASDEGRRKLNAIVHPPLLRKLRGRMVQASREYDMVVVDAALLIDWGLEREIDLTILVHAPDRIKKARLIEAGLSDQEIGSRLRVQLPFSVLKSRSDIVIYNNKSLSHLEAKVGKIINKLL